MTTADAQHDRSGRITRGWRAFRRWRRSRPFWGGLFLMLSGLEIFETTQMSLGGLTFQMGPTGFLSWLIPTILVACGLLAWFTPQQRMFYAIVGSVTAVFSLIAVNLGGFFIGLLLGMVGGALTFAWTPAPPVQPDAVDDGPADGGVLPGDDAAPSDGDPGWTADGGEPAYAPAPADMLTDTLPPPRNPLREPAPQDPAGYDANRSDGTGRHSAHWPFGDRSGSDGPAPSDADPSPRRNPRLYTALLLALSLSMAGILIVPNALPALAAAPCPIAVRPTPAATPSTPAAGSASNPSIRPAVKPAGGNIITDIVDGIRGLFGGGKVAVAPAPTPTPTEAGAPPRIAASLPAAASSPTTPTRPAPRPTSCTRPTAPKPGAAKPSAAKPGRPAPRAAAEAGQPTVAKTPSRLTGSRVAMSNLRLAGVTELPTADGGTLRVLKFTMSRAVTDDFSLLAPGQSVPSLLFKTQTLTVDGNVSFYATRFTGRIPLLGVQVTLAPDLPIPDGIPVTSPLDVVFDDPDIQLAFVDCDTLTAKPKLNLTLN